MTNKVNVIKPGLETTVQDWPGLKGAFKYGFNHSGVIDHWSFRQANILVGNNVGTPGLEAQFIGPTLHFTADQSFAITGANMNAKLDDKAVPLWTTAYAKAGQLLKLGSAVSGARTYIAFSGGILANPFLGSCATHTMAKAGGINGRKLMKDDEFTLGFQNNPDPFYVPEKFRPPSAINKKWEVEIVIGPCDDWISEKGQSTFLNSNWVVSPRSNRMGIRLDGPKLSFTKRATNKAPEHGSHPSNCVDIGYPVGGVNLCGDTPVILLNEGLTGGGFIVPFTVPSAAFPKVGQARPHESLHFQVSTVEEAQSMRKHINNCCKPNILEPQVKHPAI